MAKAAFKDKGLEMRYTQGHQYLGGILRGERRYEIVDPSKCEGLGLDGE